MDDKRLQEIKEQHDSGYLYENEDVLDDVFEELIAAYEAAQAECEKSDKFGKTYYDHWKREKADRKVARAELAEAQNNDKKLRVKIINDGLMIIALRKQLSASEAAEEIQFVANELIKEQLATSQAEVDRLREGEEELTLEEIKNKYFPNLTWEELRPKPKSIFDAQT